MKTNLKIQMVMLTILVISATAALAQVDLQTLEITGFSDFVYSSNATPDGSGDSRISHAELDLATTIDGLIGVGAALVYNNETNAFGLGALTVDFPLLGSDDGHFYPHDIIRHAGVVFGQFDVPVGLDWQVYPAIKRKLVTSPLAVSNTFNAWNDYGVHGYMKSDLLNLVAFWVNGQGCGRADYESDRGVEEIISGAFGGRLGLKFPGDLELGTSGATLLNADNQRTVSLIGGDMQWSWSGLQLKGEYLTQQLGQAGSETVESTGYYGQALYGFSDYYLVTRYGSFTPDGADPDLETKLSLGAGWVVRPSCELRFEYVAGLENINDAALFQLVVGF